MEGTPLQDLAAPDGVCFGCGSAHPTGLRIQSHWDPDGVHVRSTHLPDPQYTGWPGLVYGGFLAMLVDCHSNWTAMAYHYRAEGREPGTLPRIECVTAELGVTFLRPTPMGTELTLSARVEGELGRRSRVVCKVRAGKTLVATGDSVFVRVDTAKLAETAHSASTS